MFSSVQKMPRVEFMGAQAPSSPHGFRRFLLRTPQPPFSRVPPPLHKCSFAIVACKGMASKQGLSFKPAPADRCSSRKSTASSGSSRGVCLLEGMFTGTTWVGLLLYRALLVGGIGLSLGHPAVAAAAPAPAPASKVVSQESIPEQKAAKSSQQTEEKAAREIEEVSLDAKFWRGLDLERGSSTLILKSVLDNDPMDSSALECLARTLMDLDEYSRALLVLDKLEVLQPQELEWKYMKAEAYDMEGQSQRAKEIFQEILKVEPFSSRALQGLILAMDQLDEYETALKMLEDTWKKAKQENNCEEAGNFGMLLGQIYTFKGRFEDALTHYQGMLEENAKDFRPYLCQGIIYSVLGETDLADKKFQTFQELCPKDLPAREFLEGLMSKARKEGRRVFESKKEQKGKAVAKPKKGL